MKLGKKPARPGAMKLKFGTFFDTAALPVPPKRFGHERLDQPWNMFANDKWSCCVFAGAAHEHMVWSHMGRNTTMFHDNDVLGDYSAVTGFNAKKPDTDQGTDMEEAAAYRRKVGVKDVFGVRHRVDAYVALSPGHLADMWAATYLLGAVGLGFQFPDSAMDQTDKGEPWSVVPGSEVSGGHYVPCIGRNSTGNLLIVTWGKFQAVTPEFYEKYCDEAVAYLSLDILRDKVSPDGFDELTLRNSLRTLSKPKPKGAVP